MKINRAETIDTLLEYIEILAIYLIFEAVGVKLYWYLGLRIVLSLVFLLFSK